jgi:TPR repeat protein
MFRRSAMALASWLMLAAGAVDAAARDDRGAAPSRSGSIGCAVDPCAPGCDCRFDRWDEERRLRYGYGMTADPARAAYWYRQSAEAGDPRAQYNLGLMLKVGLGLPQDDDEALVWLRHAAERGLGEACFVLGNMARLGVGVALDLRAATDWYRRAAERGHAASQHALGNMYGNGAGVGIDLVSAYQWWQIAAAKGHPLALEARRRAAPLMSARELGLARRLAAEWRRAHAAR